MQSAGPEQHVWILTHTHTHYFAGGPMQALVTASEERTQSTPAAVAVEQITPQLIAPQHHCHTAFCKPIRRRSHVWHGSEKAPAAVWVQQIFEQIEPEHFE
jgi:hypothetical protein